MAVESLGISKLDQVAVKVDDVERAVAFYRDVLNLTHLFTVQGRFAFFDCGGTRLMLSKPDAPEFDHPTSILYFKVPDIQKSHALLVSRGVTIVEPPHLIAHMGEYDLWMTAFRDSEGNLLELSADVPVSK